MELSTVNILWFLITDKVNPHSKANPTHWSQIISHIFHAYLKISKKLTDGTLDQLDCWEWLESMKRQCYMNEKTTDRDG